MKKVSLFLATLLLGVTSHAGSYVTSTTLFRPDSNENREFELDHHSAYTWGISSAITKPGQNLNTYDGLKEQLKVGSGWSVECVTLTFEDIWDWVIEPYDRLWVNLLDTDYKGGSGKDLKKGVKEITDNAEDTASTSAGSNYFNNTKGISLGYWTDPKGGRNGADKSTVSITFTASQISTLVSYINNGGATASYAGNYADFGLAFDPDCHYYNTGIELKIVTKKYYVPESGASVAFLGTGLLAVALLRLRWLR